MGKSLVIKGADFSQCAINKSGFFGQYDVYTPAAWKPSDESLNIIALFRKSNIKFKRFIFSISDEATSVTNASNYLNSPTRFYETINGEEVEREFARGTNITPTPGSTRRYAIVSGQLSSDIYGAAVLDGNIKWVHLGENTRYVSGFPSTNVFQRLTSDAPIIQIQEQFRPSGRGILDLPATITYLGYSFNAANMDAIVIRAVNPPVGTTTAGGYGGINCNIYVPDASVDAYKSAIRFSDFASKIKPLSQYNREDYITP